MKFWDKTDVNDDAIALHEALRTTGYVHMCKLFPIEDDCKLMRLFRRMFVAGYETRVSVEEMQREEMISTLKEVQGDGMEVLRSMFLVQAGEDMSPDERKEQIEFAKKQLELLLRNCDHSKISNGYCPTCKRSFGWGCKESPDKVCHYHSWGEKGQYYITLLNGEKHFLPPGHDRYGESTDWCIFCGDPEERK